MAVPRGDGEQCSQDGMGVPSQELAIAKLDQMLKLLGMMAVKGLSQTEQIATLSRVGFSPKDIADVLGTTPNTVRVALVGIRRAGGHKKRRVISAKQEAQDA